MKNAQKKCTEQIHQMEQLVASVRMETAGELAEEKRLYAEAQKQLREAEYKCGVVAEKHENIMRVKQALEQDIIRLSSKADTASKKTSDTERLLFADAANHRRDVENLENENSRLRAEKRALEAQTDSIPSLQEEIERCRTEIARLDDDNTSLRSAMRQLDATVDVAQESLAEAERKRSEADAALGTSKDKITLLESENERLGSVERLLGLDLKEANLRLADAQAILKETMDMVEAPSPSALARIVASLVKEAGKVAEHEHFRQRAQDSESILNALSELLHAPDYQALPRLVTSLASQRLALSNAQIQLEEEVKALRSTQQRLSADLDQPFQDFIGESDAIGQVREIIKKVAATDADVLITGENGTGKELVARAVHRASGRAGEVFVSVDVGSLTGSLFESELFGHVKGAFTDAREDRAGRLELASGGTLMLDEIGNLPIDLQAKLLTVLENRQVIRVGSGTPRDIDIRLICATNLALREMVERGEFREDLLYRINTIEIPLPALRERREDIPLLAHHFLARYAPKYRKDLGGISSPAMNKLKAYHWPGNVRELQHAVERAVIMSSSEALLPGDFLFPGVTSERNVLPLDTFNLDEVEAVVIRNAMKRFGGNISKVARELGLSRPPLYRKLERHGL